MSQNIFSDKIELLVLDLDGTVFGNSRLLIEEIENNFEKISSVGIGMPGIVSKYTSLVKNANSIWLNGKPLKKDLERNLN